MNTTQSQNNQGRIRTSVKTFILGSLLASASLTQAVVSIENSCLNHKVEGKALNYSSVKKFIHSADTQNIYAIAQDGKSTRLEGRFRSLEDFIVTKKVCLEPEAKIQNYDSQNRMLAELVGTTIIENPCYSTRSTKLHFRTVERFVFNGRTGLVYKIRKGQQITKDPHRYTSMTEFMKKNHVCQSAQGDNNESVAYGESLHDKAIKLAHEQTSPEDWLYGRAGNEESFPAEVVRDSGDAPDLGIK